jgi:hypothetical protein
MQPPTDKPMQEKAFRLPEEQIVWLDGFVADARGRGLDLKRAELVRRGIDLFRETYPTLDHFLLSLRSPQRPSDVSDDQSSDEAVIEA